MALAGTLRLYRLGADPLWLDEIYSITVVRHGVPGLLANSTADPHPPFYYLALWLLSGFGAAQSEWAWRWSSAVFGALAAPGVYWLARRGAGHWPALTASAWLAVSPTHLFFSQETRWPAAAVLAAAAATALLFGLMARPEARTRWLLYAAVTAAGLFTAYSYAIVAAVQWPFAAWVVRRQPGGRRLAAGLAALLLLQALLGAQSLPAIAAEHAAAAPLRAKTVVQVLLAGDVFRYGYFWAHGWLVGVMVALAALGAWHLLRRRSRLEGAYLLAQAVVPFAAYEFVAAPLLHLNLPHFESRQFLVLLPALFALLAHGLAALGDALPPWSARAAGLALTVFVAAGSGLAIQRYWTNTRSPEGWAARYIEARLVPGDVLVNLNYFSAAGNGYYLPHVPAYGRPTLTPAGLLFPHARLRMRSEPNSAPTVPLETVRQAPRLWVSVVPGWADDIEDQLIAGCQVIDEVSFIPLRVRLVTGCGSAAGAAPPS